MSGDHFLTYMQANHQFFSLNKINDHLNLPNKRLYNYVKQTKYQTTLGDFEQLVIAFFKQLGYNEDIIYEQFLFSQNKILSTQQLLTKETEFYFVF